MITIAVVIFGALAAAILANTYLQPHLDRALADEKVDVSKAESWAGSVLGPSVTLLALFLAFVFTDVSTTYSEAKDATQTEAAVIDRLAQTARYLKDPQRRQLQVAAICYARAVAGPEWDVMKDGSGASSDLPGVWTGLGPDGMRTIFHAIGPSDALFSTLTEADRQRADARRARLTVASPSLPPILIAFMLFVTAAVLIYHAVTSPPRGVLHAFATGTSVVALLGAMGIIYTFEKPFSGALEITPASLHTAERTRSKDFVARYGAEQVRCDADGRPVKAASS